MEIDRRTALGRLAGTSLALAAGPALLPIPRSLAAAKKIQKPVIFGCGKVGSDRFVARGFDPGGQIVSEYDLPDRGHGIALDPRGQIAAIFARRPGTFAQIIDIQTGQEIGDIKAPLTRHFYGHGAIDQDGLLYASENNFAEGAGTIGVYRTRPPFTRIRELPSYGVGPHEIQLLADEHGLVIANGGIRTHPEMPRLKLNLSEMKPSLCFVDRTDGRLLRRVTLASEFHQSSIRHIAASPTGDVAVAMQFQGDRGKRAPLIGLVPIKGMPRLFEHPHTAIRSMKHYCGSIAFDLSVRFLAVSSPRGNVLTLWDVPRFAYIGSISIDDVCGICAAPTPGHFIASSGTGALYEIEGGTARAIPIPLQSKGKADGFAWDNHLTPTYT